MRYWSAKLFVWIKHQTSSHSKRLFLVSDFSPLVLYALGHKNNNNNNNNVNNNNLICKVAYSRNFRGAGDNYRILHKKKVTTCLQCRWRVHASDAAAVDCVLHQWGHTESRYSGGRSQIAGSRVVSPRHWHVQSQAVCRESWKTHVESS